MAMRSEVSVFAVILVLCSSAALSQRTGVEAERTSSVATASEVSETVFPIEWTEEEVRGSVHEDAPYFTGREAEQSSMGNLSIHVEPLPMQGSLTTERQQKNLSALKRSFLYLLIPIVLSIIAFAGLVYPKVRRLRSALDSETIGYFQLVRAVLKAEFTYDARAQALGLLYILLALHVVHRAFRVALSLTRRHLSLQAEGMTREHQRVTTASAGEEQQETQIIYRGAMKEK